MKHSFTGFKSFRRCALPQPPVCSVPVTRTQNPGFPHFRTKAQRSPSKGYTYPDNTAYYHYNKPLSQSQDFVTVFVIIDKLDTLKLCNPTKKNPASIPSNTVGIFFRGISGIFLICGISFEPLKFLRDICINNGIYCIHIEDLIGRTGAVGCIGQTVRCSQLRRIHIVGIESQI